MTGVLNAMVGQGGGLRYSVTVGNSGNNYGYNDGTPIGSISPAASYLGVTIRVCANDISGNTFTVTVNGTRAQSFFAGIEIQRTDGTIQIYYTNSASLFDASSGTVTIWQWNTASDLWTSAGTRSIRIF